MITDLMILLMAVGAFSGVFLLYPVLSVIVLKASGCNLTVREILDRL